MGKRKKQKPMPPAVDLARDAEIMAETMRQRKEKRDLWMTVAFTVIGIGVAIFLGVAVGGFFLFFGILALAGYLGNLEWVSGFGRRKVFLWQLVLVTILTATEIVVLYPMWRAEQASQLEGDLNPVPNSGIPTMEVGDSGSVFFFPPGKRPEIPVAQLAYDAGLRLEQTEKGLVVTTPVRDRNGALVVDIKANHWTVYPPYCSDKNYDSNTLEVLDNRGHVVFQLVILSNRVRIQGEWYDDNGKGAKIMRADDQPNGAYFIPLDRSKFVDTTLISPMFKYPSKQHWGEKIKQLPRSSQ